MTPILTTQALWCLIIGASPWLAALSWHDVKHRRLPNSLTLSLAAAALVFRFGFGHLPLFLDGLLGGLAAIIFLLLPFLLGGAGGGDVKMIMASGCLCGLEGTMFMLFITSAVGFLLAVVMLFAGRADASRLKHWGRCIFDWRYDRKAGREALPPKTDERVRLPFGVAIALGTWLTLALGLCIQSAQ